MNPQELFCPNMDCPARGQTGKGNLQVHSQKERRYECNVCGQTFATTKGTIFYRLRHAPELVMQVIILLANGCPIQAVVKAFGLDERTVRDWLARAGQHCQRLSECVSEQVSSFRGRNGTMQDGGLANIAIVQVVKQRVEGVLHVERRIVQGTKDLVERLI